MEQRLSRGWIWAVTGAVALISAGVVCSFHVQPLPTLVVVSTCANVRSGLSRVTGDFGTQFDVPDRLRIQTEIRDMPPGKLHVITLEQRDGRMVLWRDDDIFHELKDAFPALSKRVVVRDVSAPDGRVVGKDHWGYLKRREYWRYVTFSSGDAVGYRPVPASEARLFDQVISSACVVPRTNVDSR
jgi:hypothetical protein